MKIAEPKVIIPPVLLSIIGFSDNNFVKFKEAVQLFWATNPCVCDGRIPVGGEFHFGISHTKFDCRAEVKELNVRKDLSGVVELRAEVWPLTNAKILNDKVVEAVDSGLISFKIGGMVYLVKGTNDIKTIEIDNFESMIDNVKLEEIMQW